MEVYEGRVYIGCECMKGVENKRTNKEGQEEEAQINKYHPKVRFI